MNSLFVKTITLTLVAVFGTTFGETLLSIGMKRIGEAPPLSALDWRPFVGFYVKAFTSPYIIGGIFFLALYFFTFLQLMSWADLSLVLPMTALTFVLATLIAHLWLGETVTATRWLGTAVITLGVVIVASTGVENVSSSQAAPQAASPQALPHEQQAARR